jgi:apolipoprotein N-acyltransferase
MLRKVACNTQRASLRGAPKARRSNLSQEDCFVGALRLLAMTVAPLISAILLVLAFPRFNLQFLAWISLVPLFFAIEKQNGKTRFFIGYLFGLIFFSGILYWLVNVTVPGAVTLILILALFPALFGSLYAIHNTQYAILYVPSLWVLTEYLRSHFLSGFPWALLGYSQSLTLPIIQIADITGPYGVSFLIVLVNLSFYLMLKKSPKRFHILFFVLFLLVLVLSYGHNRLNRNYPRQTLKVAVVQGNIPQEMKWDPAHRGLISEKYTHLTLQSLKDAPRLVVWPETSVPGYLEGERDLKEAVTSLAEESGVYILAGTLREERQRFFNSATLVSNNGKILESYDKIHLVPFGEFVPFDDAVSWIRSYIDKPIGDFDKGKGFTVFNFDVKEKIPDDKNIHKITEFYKFSALICFEDIFPDLCRRFVKRGARFLVNMTNDAWFGKSPAPYQHAQGSVFRAVENRVPVVRAANTGLSCIIDHRGKMLNSVRVDGEEVFVEGFASGLIRPIFGNTFYTRYGDVFSWICAIVVLFGLVRRRVRNSAPVILLSIAILASLLSGCLKDDVHYKGKFRFSMPFSKKYDYNDILVVRAVDGDTVELENGEKVRLIGIDTPEAWYGPKLERDARRTKRDHRTIMKMGKRAADFTKKLVTGKKVRLEFDVEKRDRYGRLLAYLYLPDGKMLNSELLSEGYAQVYTFQPNVKYLDKFLELQKEARDNERGFWKE